MPERPLTSRQRYAEYRREFVRRQQAGEIRPGGSPHSHHEPRPGRQRSFLTLLFEFLKLARAERWALALALGTVSVSTFLRMFPPAATKVAMDYVLTAGRWPEEAPAWLAERLATRGQLLVALAVGVLALTLLESLVHLWGRWYATRTSKRLQVSVRRRLFAHAVRLPLHRVYELKSGGATSVLREDAGGVAELVFSMLYNPFRAIIQLIGSLCVLAWVDWRLLTGSVVLLPMVFYTHRAWIGRIRPLHRDIRRQRQEVDGQTTEAFAGMRVVRAFGRQRSETSRFTRGNHVMARQELAAWWWARGVELTWEILLPAASAGLLWYGGMRVLSGALTIGDLTMFLAYLAMLLGPLAVLATTATQFQNNLAGLDRVLDLLDEPREMAPAPGALKLHAADVIGRIAFRQVRFRYPKGQQDVLSEIDLDIQPGELVALVGPSGAGKTTLCNLVARFYDPTAGSVELDGVDLRQIDVESYRRLLGIVEQDIFLFDGSIADNIAYGRRGASEDEIRAAAQVANADEFIQALERGYNTVIGERGVRLSGGQRQRIAIARAVLSDPRILILDEATSNLDTESERLIQQSLERLMRGRTSFVIAHRLSTIVHADRILLVEDGRITQQGTHAEMLASSPRYRRLAQLQLGPSQQSPSEALQSEASQPQPSQLSAPQVSQHAAPSSATIASVDSTVT